MGDTPQRQKSKNKSTRALKKGRSNLSLEQIEEEYDSCWSADDSIEDDEEDVIDNPSITDESYSSGSSCQYRLVQLICVIVLTGFVVIMYPKFDPMALFGENASTGGVLKGMNGGKEYNEPPWRNPMHETGRGGDDEFLGIGDEESQDFDFHDNGDFDDNGGNFDNGGDFYDNGDFDNNDEFDDGGDFDSNDEFDNGGDFYDNGDFENNDDYDDGGDFDNNGEFDNGGDFDNNGAFDNSGNFDSNEDGFVINSGSQSNNFGGVNALDEAVSDLPVMHTFFERVEKNTGMTDTGDDMLLETWVDMWKDAGWNPIILGVEDAKKHPDFEELNQMLEDFKFNDYNKMCFIRWIAVAAVGGGWMCDYDIFPLNPFNAEGEEFTRMAHLLIENYIEHLDVDI
eukprot:7281021-Ditylum_brightwellii.AAC.1